MIAKEKGFLLLLHNNKFTHNIVQWWSHNILVKLRMKLVNGKIQFPHIWTTCSEILVILASHFLHHLGTKAKCGSADSRHLGPAISVNHQISISEGQGLHTASWQAQKHIPRVHGSPGIPSLVHSLPPPGLVSCITLQLPSLHWSHIHCSTWLHFHGAIWLECHQHGAWNKNVIGHWPDYFSPPRVKNRLGTRLDIRNPPLVYVKLILVDFT